MAQMVLSMAVSYILGRIFAPDIPPQEGPRLQDLKIQNSGYGVPIPFLYGAARLAGNVIWSTDLIETRREEEVGGGKGGGDEQTVITYTYSIFAAIAICRGPITGIRRIWANAELIYDAGSGATGEAAYVSASFANSIRIYVGNESQLPDPTMESYLGVGQVPGYRGQAYVVFSNFQLEKFGNRLPSFSFEVMKAGTLVIPRLANTITYSGTDLYSNTGIQWAQFDGGVTTAISFQSGSPSQQWFTFVRDINGNLLSYSAKSFDSVNTSPPAEGNFLGLIIARSANGLNNSWGILGSHRVKRFEASTTSPLGATGFMPYPKVWKLKGKVYLPNTYKYDGTNYTLSVYRYSIDADGLPSPIYEKLIQVATGTPRLINNVSYVDKNYFYVMQCFPGGGDNYLWKYSTGLDLIKQWLIPSIPTNTFPAIIVWEDTLYFGGGNNGGSATVYALNADGSATSMGTFAESTAPSNAGMHVYPSHMPPIAFGSHQTVSMLGAFTVGVGDTVPLSTIVQDICTESGLQVSDLDVSDLASTNVRGYVITNRTEARTAIEPLQKAFFFDAVESGTVIKFVRRGGSSVRTVSTNDCVLYTGISQESNGNGKVQMTRTQELDLPVSFDVLFLNTNTDYQQGAQQERRLATQAVNALKINLPMSLNDSEAKFIAASQLYNVWAERTRLRLSLGNKHSDLEPTDVLVLNDPGSGTSRTLRMIRKSEALSGSVTFDAVEEDVSAYTQTMTTANANSTAQTLAADTKTIVALLDLPLLQDSDNEPGTYVGLSGYSTGWKAATLFKSTDEGATYTIVDSFVTRAGIGYAMTVLGIGRIDIFDDQSSVQVKLYPAGFTLSSTTEINVLNGSNAILVGREIIQYKTATLQADGSYILTGLLRGRRGTNWARTLHLAGEQVVVLASPAIRVLPLLTSELNLARDYKGVTVGQLVQEQSSIKFVNRGETMVPFAPVEFQATRKLNYDWVFTWKRQTRIDGSWRDGVDVALSEDTESYYLEFFHWSDFPIPTGITKGLPTLIETGSTTNLSTGDKVKIYDIKGMTELNGRTFTVTAVSVSAYSLDGVDSSLYEDWVSGGTTRKVMSNATVVSALTYTYLVAQQTTDLNFATGRTVVRAAVSQISTSIGAGRPAIGSFTQSPNHNGSP